MLLPKWTCGECGEIWFTDEPTGHCPVSECHSRTVWEVPDPTVQIIKRSKMYRECVAEHPFVAPEHRKR